MDDIQFPALVVFNDGSFRIVTAKDEFQTNVNWSMAQYTADDVLVDSNGNQFRLTSRDDTELVCDILLGSVGHELCSPNSTTGYDLNTLLSNLKAMLLQAKDDEKSVLQVVICNIEQQI
ncbi:hypothetical protein GLP21_02885 [Photobacterium carnosum]|uniref:hypothetical protein n=1 Tax=Photobacterium carnosum TaxID=2023717 RepID=UPI001E37FB44|nr:hypothetical protein [Photobacterium carnosum]MCD9547618.1 hypothetical protein [Photobacterium carnosum]MCF2305457.1 hypothetical protein [Photobacterium carnosum]